MHASFVVVPLLVCSLLLYKVQTSPLKTLLHSDTHTYTITKYQMAEPVLDSVHVNGEYVTKMVSDSLPANGGHGKYSYSKNSYYQVCATLLVYPIKGKNYK